MIRDDGSPAVLRGPLLSVGWPFLIVVAAVALVLIGVAYGEQLEHRPRAMLYTVSLAGLIAGIIGFIASV